MSRKKRKVYKPVNKVYYDTSHHKDQKCLDEFSEEKKETEEENT
jgi:hypothetical protein